MGANACKAGNAVLRKKNDSVQLKHTDIIELLEKQYLYSIEFHPNPKSDSEISASDMVGKQTTINHFLVKRKTTDGMNIESETKRQKTEDSWLEVDGGKLIVYTNDDGAQHKPKVS